MAWLCNAPNVEQTLQHDDASNRRQLFDFIDSFVCTHNPAVLPDGSNLDTAPNASINPHVYSRPHSDIEDLMLTLYLLVNDIPDVLPVTVCKPNRVNNSIDLDITRR